MKTTTETRNFKEVVISTVSLPDGRIETIIFFNGLEAKCMSVLTDPIKQHNAAVNFAKKATLTIENFSIYMSI